MYIGMSLRACIATTMYDGYMHIDLITIYQYIQARDGFGGGGSGGCNPPNGQSHSIKCSTTRYAQALIYIAKSLVVIVVSSK